MWKDFQQKKEERHRSCHLSRPVSAGSNLQPKHYLDTLADPHLRSCISSIVSTFADEPHLVLPLQCWGTRLSAPHHDDLLTTLLILRWLHHHALMLAVVMFTVWWLYVCRSSNIWCQCSVVRRFLYFLYIFLMMCWLSLKNYVLFSHSPLMIVMK